MAWFPEHNEDSFSHGFAAGVLTAAAGILLAAVLWFAADELHMKLTSDDTGAEVLTDAKTKGKLKEIEYLIKQNYLGDVDSEMLSTYLFKGVAAGLDDVYAAYYSSEELTTIQADNQGEYFGIGAVLSQDPASEKYRVSTVYEDTPAQAGGLKEGDILLRIDGQSLEDMALSEVVALIKGKTEAFHMEIYRTESGETLQLTLNCADVEMDYVENSMLPDQTGYIQLTKFTTAAVEQFADAVDELTEAGMQTLIVDLRGNPGGLLTSVCDILDLFLDEKLIVYTEDRKGNRREIYSEAGNKTEVPVAVLINGKSASASEIFAGALQDWEIGTIVGTQSYGKGVVQKTYMLNDGSAIKFTAEKYFTPKGQDINGNGITPDFISEEIPKNDRSDDTGDILLEDPVIQTAYQKLNEGYYGK